MTKPERLPQVAKVMNEYGIQILGFSEVRWDGFGETTESGLTFLYSGKEDEAASREYGVGLLISRNAKNSLLQWKPISERIITARFTIRVRKISVVHAPTNASTPECKALFYKQLQFTLSSIKKQDIVIVMGDFNTNMGADNRDREDHMGPYGGTGVINENGELFGDLCSSNGLVIGGTMFQHKECHKETWISPDGVTRNQMKLVCNFPTCC